MPLTKKTLAILVPAMLVSFLAGALAVQYKLFPLNYLSQLKKSASTDNRLPNAFYHRASFFAQHGRHDAEAVFVGDSLTAGAEWAEMFPEKRVVNRGIAGDRTQGVLERMDSIYASGAKKAFVMIGRNDFNRGASAEDVLSNYIRILQGLTAHGIHVYVQSTLLGGRLRGEANARITALNRRLQQLAENDPRLTFIDLNAGLAPSGELEPRFSRDGIHLNGEGYAVWKTAIMPYLD